MKSMKINMKTQRIWCGKHINKKLMKLSQVKHIIRYFVFRISYIVDKYLTKLRWQNDKFYQLYTCNAEANFWLTKKFKLLSSHCHHIVVILSSYCHHIVIILSSYCHHIVMVKQSFCSNQRKLYLIMWII